MNPLPRTLPIKRASHVYLVREGHLLLVQERMEDGSIFYGLPGGKAQPGESLGAAAVRQVRYETGHLRAEFCQPARGRAARRHAARLLCLLRAVYGAV